MNRRTYLGAIAGSVTATMAGCIGDFGGTDIDEDEYPVAAWADGEIEFGLPPFQDTEELTEQYAGTFEWLENGFDELEAVEGTPTTDYSGVVESVVNGHTELANLSPFIFVLAQEDDVHPLAINWSHGSDSYHTYIATRAETEIESIDDLEGKTIAMVDPMSASGGMFPRYRLSQAGFHAGDLETEPEDFDVQWAGSHDSALRVLEEGHVDAAAYGDFQHPDDDEIVTIAESDPIPFDVIVAKPDTPEDVREALTERLIDTPEESLEDHRVDEYGAFDPDLYDHVRDIADEMGVDIETLDEAEDEGEGDE
ncbi:phosphate/phosphite/phosphonate ABC transporter substrate-binding protein [Natronolimnohabitans sp. A-GB9]|uniref:phosphate/phosphite/phosphonate ABC transporter substrate-binding protein n=1 Tax=Natronolimnohabitans sp. A-GB9 TaxID=3069757 RepID=UPI0027ADEA9F|nr:phosphate/phosphite/phosphonate ABC transporter substrate-binding protein [Natronolimnohabitans sp. A-GB9]MDQ2049556.1 phosphate/phosphite/phosphonate ABC transporter substrate-binding protein [Natronolimnohabitans sp. A-GB9]